ncbi:MAG TPA: 23S rRNA (guanosine(2251)-2'-O)-methyltransferase RlmB [Alphaproteobacteria bacterium]|nr:23S rRNA (guanosine(2251)-2'-O)-methyltransferase RlmB [Alphaproteobacteria bacterium]
MAKRKPQRRFSRPPSLPSKPAIAPQAAAAGTSGGEWLYGVHPVLAALGNPRRRCRRLLATEEVARGLGDRLESARVIRPSLALELHPRAELDRLFPGAVHQGLALAADPLDEPSLDDLLREIGPEGMAVLVVLDQVTDPHNVGAVLRSAAAFGARAVIATERHAPAATAALAKAASGALEAVPLVRVTNLARSLESLKEGGFWCVGLDAAAPDALGDARLAERIALVLGAEGHGMRRLTRVHCDLLLRIPIAPAAVASLNVSNAAAVALYELARRRASRQ